MLPVKLLNLYSNLILLSNRQEKSVKYPPVYSACMG